MHATTTGWVSLRDIAERAGVSRATVSMALRNHPKVARSTALALQKVAQELGYRSNPLLSTISGLRRRGERIEPKPLQEVAVITSRPTGAPRGASELALAARVEAVQSYAAALGYQLVIHELLQDENAAEHLGRKLFVRGCEALIAMPPERADFAARFPWERFTAVGVRGVGGTTELPVHEVVEDPFAGATRIAMELAARGYQRPGLVLRSVGPETLELQRLEAAWLQGNPREPGGWAPGMICRVAPGDDAAIVRWCEATGPDVIIGSDLDVLRALERSGLFRGDQLGFATLRLEEEALETGVAGLRDTTILQLRAAVNLLEQEQRLLHRGIPEYRQLVPIKPLWFEGNTLRPPVVKKVFAA